MISHDPRVPCPKPIPEAEHTFPELLATLYKKKHTGRVILHFHNGVPRIIEIAHKFTYLKSLER